MPLSPTVSPTEPSLLSEAALLLREVDLRTTTWIARRDVLMEQRAEVERLRAKEAVSRAMQASGVEV